MYYFLTLFVNAALDIKVILHCFRQVLFWLQNETIYIYVYKYLCCLKGFIKQNYTFIKCFLKNVTFKMLFLGFIYFLSSLIKIYWSFVHGCCFLVINCISCSNKLKNKKFGPDQPERQLEVLSGVWLSDYLISVGPALLFSPPVKLQVCVMDADDVK